MQTRFPRENAAWRDAITRMILQRDVDIKRLWRSLPQIPDPEAGRPFAGPLDPTPFIHFPPIGSGGTGDSASEVSGISFSGTSFGCPSFVAISIADMLPGAGCADCSSINGVWTLDFSSGTDTSCGYVSGAGNRPVACGVEYTITAAFFGVTTGQWVVSFETRNSLARYFGNGPRFGTTQLLLDVGDNNCIWTSTIDLTTSQ